MRIQSVAPRKPIFHPQSLPVICDDSEIQIGKKFTAESQLRAFGVWYMKDNLTPFDDFFYSCNPSKFQCADFTRRI